MAGVKNIVVTSITDQKDTLRNDQNTEGAKFIAFTDQSSNVWEVRPPYSLFKSPIWNSRIQRTLIHQYVDADYSLWIDGNIALKVPMKRLIDEWMQDFDIATWKHPWRDCLYKELEISIQLKLDDSNVMEEEIKQYKKEGIPEHSGLPETWMILRKHNKKVETFNNLWWSQTCRYSQRNQSSFVWAAGKAGLKVNYIEGNTRSHPYFSYIPHSKY